MKKIFRITPILLTSLFVFSACNNATPVDPTPVEPDDPIDEYDEPKLATDTAQD